MYRSQQHERIAVVDVFGDHALHCRLGSGLRTRLWHDPIVRECLALARMARISRAPEVPGHVLFLDKRPGLVIFNEIDCKNQTPLVLNWAPLFPFESSTGNRLWPKGGSRIPGLQVP